MSCWQEKKAFYKAYKKYNPMTPEELMIPRYKVIGDYPNSPYKLDDIILLSKRSFHLTTTSYRNEFGETITSENYFSNDEIKKYPKLFLKINL